MTAPFVYQPRSLRDIVCRAAQTVEVTDRPPRVEMEEKCGRCGHIRAFHCFVRRSPETRETLFVARSRGQYYWQRVHAYSRFQSGYSAVRCKHASEDRTDFPLCNSSACTCWDGEPRKPCPCAAYVSPYKKARAPKKKAPTEGTGKRKRKATGQGELFEGGV